MYMLINDDVLFYFIEIVLLVYERYRVNFELLFIYNYMCMYNFNKWLFIL